MGQICQKIIDIDLNCQGPQIQSEQISQELIVDSNKYLSLYLQNSISQSNQSPSPSSIKSKKLPINHLQQTQIKLNKHPLNSFLVTLYSKCRIERPVKVNNGTYQGQWHQGKYCGFGKLFYDNGSTYEGFWLMGMKHHHGMFVQNNIVQCGRWFADQFLGEEVTQVNDIMIDKNLSSKNFNHLELIIYDDGSQYRGKSNEQGKQGKGFFRIPNGQIYIGDFLNDKMDGYGILIDQKEVYRGQFSANMKHGLGHLRVKDQIYVGSFLNNVAQNYGFSIQIQ